MSLLLYSHSILDLPGALPASSSSGRIRQKPLFLSSSSLDASARSVTLHHLAFSFLSFLAWPPCLARIKLQSLLHSFMTLTKPHFIVLQIHNVFISFSSSSAGTSHCGLYLLPLADAVFNTPFSAIKNGIMGNWCEYKQVGCGSVAVDFLAEVASYPKPDDKIRSTSLKVLFPTTSQLIAAKF